MAKITDGTFQNWQDGQTIHGSDYTKERELLRAAVNDNDSRLGTLESSTVGLQLGNLQLQKITNDSGGVKLSVNLTNDPVSQATKDGQQKVSEAGSLTLDPNSQTDLLNAVKKAGVGLHTFYAQAGTKNLPPGNRSIRGIAHITASNPTFGYIWAMDYQNNFFYNYIDTDVWAGWDGPNMPQTELWSSSGWYMQASQIAYPTKKLSECKTGWILVWSDYDAATKKVNDYDFNYTHIPKYAVSKYSGKMVFFPIMNYLSATSNNMTGKKLYVYDDRLVGHDDNGSSDTQANDVVLRAVVEY